MVDSGGTSEAVDGYIRAENAAALFEGVVSRMRGNVDERFTMNSYAKGLAAMLQDSSLPIPLLMGINGEYGSGKTQLIKAVLWKIRRVCGFNCTNMSRPIAHKEVTWIYQSCGCRVSFFVYLILVAVAFLVVVAGVASFMIWAAVAYHGSVLKSSQNASAPNATPSPSGDELLSYDVLYPLFAASAFMGAGLLLVLAVVIAYYCKFYSPSEVAVLWQQFKITLVMLFCETPPAPAMKKHDKVELIPVVFDAWEYAGCDVLWAGIIKNIFHQVADVFGKWKLRFYRTFRSVDLSHRHDFTIAQSGAAKDLNAYFGESLTSKNENQIDLEMLRKKTELRPRDVVVHTAKWLHVPYPILVFFALSTVIVSVLVLILFAAASHERELVVIEKYIQLAAGMLLGLTALSQISNIWAFLQSACSSQANQLEKALQKIRGPDLTSDLGFMHTVKVEVRRITSFVKLMERLYQKNFRILIVIDDLDKCEANRIMSILEAVSILLSDEDSLFVTLIAIDHNTASRAVSGEKSDSNEYLRRLIQMRFCIPEWTASDIESVLDRNVCQKEECEATAIQRMQSRRPNGSKKFSEPVEATNDGENTNLTSSKDEVANEAQVKSKLRRRMTKLAIEELKRRIDMLPTSFRDVRHLCNMVFFTVYLWVDKVRVGHEELDSLQLALTDTCIKLTWWVIMTEEWPYRCSWMLKHIEDMDELVLKQSHGQIGDDSAHQQDQLFEVYQHVRERIKEPEDWRMWISSDSNPDHFDVALDAFPLTVRAVKYFLPFTINLDRAIKYYIAEHCKTREYEPCSRCQTLSTPGTSRSRAQTRQSDGEAGGQSCDSSHDRTLS